MLTLSASLPDGEWMRMDDTDYWQAEDSAFLEGGTYRMRGTLTNKDLLGGTKKQIRRCTVGDELADKAAAQARPSTRAIRLANAILLEQILETGHFRSPAALAEKIGISRSLISELLSLLDMPPDQMEKILFETK